MKNGDQKLSDKQIQMLVLIVMSSRTMPTDAGAAIHVLLNGSPVECVGSHQHIQTYIYASNQAFTHRERSLLSIEMAATHN